MAKKNAEVNITNEQVLLRYAEESLKPAYIYLKEKFDNDLQHTLTVFKAARYVSPSKVDELKLSTSA